MMKIFLFSILLVFVFLFLFLEKEGNGEKEEEFKFSQNWKVSSGWKFIPQIDYPGESCDYRCLENNPEMNENEKEKCRELCS